MCIIYILTLIYIELFCCLFVPLHFQLMLIKHQIDEKFHLILAVMLRTSLYNEAQ